MNDVLLKEFLIEAYLGFDSEDVNNNRELVRSRCINRAYRDMCRTLRFKKNTSNKRGIWKSAVSQVISDAIDTVLCRIKDFDDFHAETCEAMRNCDSKGVFNLGFTFSYGQAQKWLNMTYKYLWIIGYWGDDNRSVEEVLHIPVDNVIRQVALVDPNENPGYANQFGLDINQNNLPSQEWSKWDGTEYIAFKNEVALQISTRWADMPPIVWETKAWLEQVRIERMDR